MKIVIEDLTFECIIGLLDFERLTAQKVIVNLEFDYDYKNSNTFIDYSKVTNLIEKIMKEKKFELLEDAIIYIENHLNNLYNISNLRLKISKPNIITNCIVSLEIP